MSPIEIRHVAGTAAEVGEGAVWDVAERALYWVDIPQGFVHRHDPATAENRRWEIGEPVGCLAVREAGGDPWYLLALDEGHGFRKKSNRDFQREAETLFLEEVLSR